MRNEAYELEFHHFLFCTTLSKRKIDLKGLIHYNDILTDIDMSLIVENSISNGISTFIYRYK